MLEAVTRLATTTADCQNTDRVEKKANIPRYKRDLPFSQQVQTCISFCKNSTRTTKIHAAAKSTAD